VARFFYSDFENDMGKINLFLMTLIAATFTSCEVIGDIFGAGFYTGVFVVIFVIVLVIALVARIFRR